MRREMGGSVPPKQWTIYSLADPRTEEIRYVGVTKDRLKQRLKEHWAEFRRRSTPKAQWLTELRAQELKPICSVLEEGVGPWITAEQKWIAHYRQLGCKLTNSTIGGQGHTGYRHTEESRIRMSKPRSPEGRAAIAAANRKRTYDPELLRFWRQFKSDTVQPETRAKISAALRGKVRSKEQRANMAAARRAWLDADPSRREELRNLPLKPGTAAKIAATLRGRKLSPETLEKLRGRNLSQEHCAKLAVLMSKRKRDPKTGQVLPEEKRNDA